MCLIGCMLTTLIIVKIMIVSLTRKTRVKPNDDLMNVKKNTHKKTQRTLQKHDR